MTVEFPAILLNLQTGNIESEFHQYVLPEENPLLSDFCKQLTGITQVCCELELSQLDNYCHYC